MPDSIYSQNAWLDMFMHNEPADACDRERVSKIVSMIPSKVGSVLDVGVGGGYIFRELKRRGGISSVGLDISLELVKRLKERRVCVGDAKAIPFKDGQFDLVLGADVIEHIKEDHFNESVSELVRVSREFILINSPYKDSVDWPVSLCSRCDKEFNVYGHMRRIDMALIRRIFPDSRFDILKVEFFGKRREARPQPMVHMARRWGKVYSREGVVCPHCLNSEIKQPDRNLAQRFFGGAVCALFMLMDNLTLPFVKVRSEMCVLIRKKQDVRYEI
jgi:SAM-dependent methyltransferase